MFATTVLASAIVSTVAGMPITNWPVVKSAEGKFTVRFPGPVDDSVEEVETDLGKVARHTFSCSTGNALWQLTYTDLPKQMMVAKSLILDLAFEGARMSEKDLLFAESNGSLRGAPWKRFRVQPQAGPVVSSFVLVNDARLYHLQVVSPPDRFRRVGTSQFFESFAIDQS